MTDDFISVKLLYYPVMKECDRNNQKQLWECVGDKKYDIIQSLSRRYIYYGEAGEVTQYVTTKNTQPSENTTWQRFGSEKDVCSQGSS